MALVTGSAGPDNLQGTPGDDDLQGLDGNDNLSDFQGGNDRLTGGAGNDSLSVSRGLGSSSATLDGGDGNDSLSVNGVSSDGGGRVSFTMTGGAGNDNLRTFGGNVSGLMDAGAGDDVVTVTLIHEDLTVRLGPGGADRIFVEMNVAGDLKAPVVIEDFQPGDGGDVFEMLLNIFSFENFDFSNPFGAGGFLRLVQIGADAVLQIDRDGGGDNFREMARFTGVQASQFTAKNFGGFPPNGESPAGRVITGSTVFVNGSSNEVSGGIGPDTINGQFLPDRILAGPGNDVIDGGTGADHIFTEYGDDTANGGEGADTLEGGQRDLLRGDAGNDVLRGASYFDPAARFTLEGGAGDDFLLVTPIEAGHTGVAFGGDGADRFDTGGAGAATVDGGAGEDVVLLRSFAGPVTAILGSGQDVLYLFSGQPSRTVVSDFSAGAGGDRIRLIDFLTGANPGWSPETNPFAAGLARLVGENGGTTMQLRFEGQWRDSLVLQGVSPVQLNGANFEGYNPDGGPPQGLVLQGQAGADSLLGGVGGDALNGSDGLDTLAGGLGGDTLDGGVGDDSLLASAGADVMRGGAGNDHIGLSFQLPTPGANGGDGPGGGGIQAFGGDGDDILNLRYAAGSGEMLLDGGEGQDQLTLSVLTPGTVRLLGGGGADSITVRVTAESPALGAVDAGAGNDGVTLEGLNALSVTLGPGSDVISATPSFRGGAESTVTDFSLSDDRIALQASGSRLGQQGGDTLVQFFDAATDTWTSLLRLQGVGASGLQTTNFTGFFPGVPPIWQVGGAGADVLNGGAFARIDGGGGDDLVGGTVADELLRGSAGADTLTGGAGIDTLNGGLGDDNVAAGEGDDSIAEVSGSNYLRGDAGGDRIVGGTGFDDINGNMGADTASGGEGTDWVVGGKDSDLLSGDGGDDIVYGNLGDDTCNGSVGADLIRGGQGADSLSGFFDNDFLSGDRGDDTVSGGFGADVFHTFGEAGLDRVLDFSAAQGDRVQLEAGTQFTVAQVGADTVINMSGGGQMILVGVLLDALPAGWIFGA